MYESYNNIFWLNKPEILLKSTKLFGNNSISIEDDYNSYTRLALIISFLLIFLHPKISLFFLIFSIIFIIIMYYVKKNMELKQDQIKENFSFTEYQNNDLMGQNNQGYVTPTPENPMTSQIRQRIDNNQVDLSGNRGRYNINNDRIDDLENNCQGLTGEELKNCQDKSIKVFGNNVNQLPIKSCPTNLVLKNDFNKTLANMQNKVAIMETMKTNTQSIDKERYVTPTPENPMTSQIRQRINDNQSDLSGNRGSYNVNNQRIIDLENDCQGLSGPELKNCQNKSITVFGNNVDDLSGNLPNANLVLKNDFNKQLTDMQDTINVMEGMPSTKERYSPEYQKPTWPTGYTYVNAIQKKDNICENPEKNSDQVTKIMIAGGNAGNPDVFMQVDPKQAGKFCYPSINHDKDVVNNPNYVSLNQKYANQDIDSNIKERTKINPIVTQPIYDRDWMDNSFSSPSQINSETNVELYDSGYLLKDSTCCSNVSCNDNISGNCECDINKPVADAEAAEAAAAAAALEASQVVKTPPEPIQVSVNPGQSVQINPTQEESVERYSYPYNTEGKCASGCTDDNSCDCNDCPRNEYKLIPNQKDDLNTSMGYFPQQVLENNLPSNLAVGECQKGEHFKEYNKNLYSNIIQPGVYSRSEVIEPISSNLGISSSLQLQDVNMEKDCDNSINYISRDPRQISMPYGTAKAEAAAAAAASASMAVAGTPIDPAAAAPVMEKYQPVETPVESNVYDPRFHSYGTSYRAYNDKLTGQPRFYYDDIDVQRRPNYITRNNIDHTDYGTSTGAMDPKQFTNQNNVRELANKTFVDNELHFRTDMQERLMRKAHQNSWQQRQAPIHHQFM